MVVYQALCHPISLIFFFKFTNSTLHQFFDYKDSNCVLGACAQGVSAGFTSYSELASLATEMWDQCKHAFNEASLEPKHNSREELISQLDPPACTATASRNSSRQTSANNYVRFINWKESLPTDETVISKKKKPKGMNLMRKHMTQVIVESMDRYPEVLFLCPLPQILDVGQNRISSPCLLALFTSTDLNLNLST